MKLFTKEINSKWNYVQKIIKRPGFVKSGSDRSVCVSRLIKIKDVIRCSNIIPIDGF